MTEHEHMPPISRYAAARLTSHQVLATFDGTVRVLKLEEAERLRDALDAALDGPGPEVVCEVVR